MAVKTIRFSGFAGVKQGVGADIVPLNWAENAQNVSTTGGKLCRVKGYRAILPTVSGAARKLRRLYIWPRGNGTMDCLVARQDTLFRYDPGTNSWWDLYHYSNDMDADTFDFLKTKIGSTETLLVGNGLESILKWEGGNTSIAGFGSATGLSDKAVNFLELYFGRLFAAGDGEYPARLYWSQAPGGNRTIEDWSADENSENVSGGHVEVGTDSDPITGLFALSNQLLIFKRDKLYRLLGDRPGNYRIVPVEAALTQPIHRACVRYGDRLFFLTDKGLYFFDGQTVRRTSHGADLVPLLAQVDFSAAASAVCGDSLYFAVKEHATSVHNDLLIEYDVLRDCFLLRRGFQTVDLMSCYGTLYILTGKGEVAILNEGTTYGGDAIQAFWETPWLDGTSSLTVKQTVEAVLTGTGGPVKVLVLGQEREGDGVGPLSGENTPTEFLLRSVGRRLKLRVENVSGSDFDISGGMELLFDEQRRVL
jgi:hypothetical protein